MGRSGRSAHTDTSPLTLALSSCFPVSMAFDHGLSISYNCCLRLKAPVHWRGVGTSHIGDTGQGELSNGNLQWSGWPQNLGSLG